MPACLPALLATPCPVGMSSGLGPAPVLPHVMFCCLRCDGMGGGVEGAGVMRWRLRGHTHARLVI